MKKYIKIAQIANYLAAFLLFAFGVTYFFKSSFMPYHEEAVGVPWSQLETPVQVLILALMRCVGGGFLAVSVTIFLLQYHFTQTARRWVAWVIFASGWIVTCASIYATVLVRLHTLGNPPTGLASFGLLLLFIGLVFNRKSIN